LKHTIEEITGIKDLYEYKTASVAQKMSWASRRQTTRIEDQAYCLLGLFGVHMPPLYGEEEHAFFRLQLEIIAKTNDDSIFAWNSEISVNHGLLAHSPNNFMGSHSVVKATWDHLRPPHVMTSQGVYAHFQLISLRSEYLAPLNCGLRELDEPRGRKISVIALPLEQFNTPTGSIWRRKGRFEIVELHPLETAKKERTKLHVPQIPQLVEGEHRNTGVVTLILVPYKALNDRGFRKEHFSTLSEYVLVSREEGYFIRPGDFGHRLELLIRAKPKEETRQTAVAVVIFRNVELQRFGLVIGFLGGRLWVDIVVLDAEETGHQILSRSIGQEKLQPVRKLVMGRDRISRPFSNGSLNCRLMKTTSDRNLIADVTFDPEGKLSWPVRGP
jgi:hypothetical protein